MRVGKVMVLARGRFRLRERDLPLHVGEKGADM